MNIEALKHLHRIVWEFRAEMQDAFPTPGRDDSLAFAFTEAAGEALAAQHGWPDELDAAMFFSGRLLDAELRLNPRYKRNNDKEHSIPRELTQCAMMLLTAVPYTWRGWNALDDCPMTSVWTPRNIAIRVGECLEVPSDFAYILRTVAAINTAVKLTEMLPAELDRMRAKHGNTNGHGGALRDVTPPDYGKNVYSGPGYTAQSERLILADYADGNGVE